MNQITCWQVYEKTNMLSAFNEPKLSKKYSSSPLQLIASETFSHGSSPLKFGKANMTIMIVRNKMKLIDKEEVYFSASRLSKHDSGATIKKPMMIQSGLWLIAALV